MVSRQKRRYSAHHQDSKHNPTSHMASTWRLLCHRRTTRYHHLPSPLTLRHQWEICSDPPTLPSPNPIPLLPTKGHFNPIPSLPPHPTPNLCRLTPIHNALLAYPSTTHPQTPSGRKTHFFPGHSPSG